MKYVKYMLVVFLCVFSFYFSDRMLLYVENLSPLMKTINEVKEKETTEPVNAIIEGNTIIPGKNGKTVNVRESYLKMNDFGTFNETFFVYDYIKPEISLENNLDKTIVGGSDTKSITLIVQNDAFENYLLEEEIPFAKIIEEEEEMKENDTIEYINGNSNVEKYKDLNIFLKRKKKNKKMCLVGYSNIEACKENKYYLISPSIEFYKTNLAVNKSKIRGGSIVFIHDNLSLPECKIILNEIKYHNLNIIKLSDFIKE